MTQYRYAGSELSIFAEATTWQSYVRSHVRAYVGKQVLEVGTGLGSVTEALYRDGVERWVCLEPDARLAGKLVKAIADGVLPPGCEVVEGTLGRVDEHQLFDSVLYMDVLEHIEDDAGQLGLAAEHLRSSGHLIVVSPAHQWLFSPFDQSIGHLRRYTKRTLSSLTPKTTDLVRLQYLDPVGLLSSLGNRLLMRRSVPTRRQIVFWDKLMVPVSRILDPLLAFSVGKSVVAIWRKRLLEHGFKAFQGDTL